MKYRPSQYAETLYVATIDKTAEEQKKIVKRFADLLVRHQMTGKVTMIVEAYEKLILQKGGLRRVRIETAYQATETLKRDIRACLGKNIHIEEEINSHMLGGVKILVDDEILIDASVKRQLDNLFIKKPSSG